MARGYVYYVSLKGVTGAGNLDLSAIAAEDPAAAQAYQAADRRRLRHPRCGDRAGGREAVPTRVVIGSRIVQEIEKSTGQNVVANVSRLVKELRQAVDKA